MGLKNNHIVRRDVLKVTAIAATLPSLTAWAQPTAGRFVGNLRLEMLPDGRRARLLEAFGYIDPNGVEWNVPSGQIVDGASIPRILWGPIGGPWDGLYRFASVIHDHYCDIRRRPWTDTHRVFHDAMKTSEVPTIQANYMYFAVRKFGPRWSQTTVENTQSLLNNPDALASQLSAISSPTSLASRDLTTALQDASGRAFTLHAADPMGEPSLPSGADLRLLRSISSAASSDFGQTTVDFTPSGNRVEVTAAQTPTIDPAAIDAFAARDDIDRLTPEDIERLADAPDA